MENKKKVQMEVKDQTKKIQNEEVDLKSLIKKTKNLLVTNSKDAKFANKLLGELESLVKQESIEPAYVHIPVDKDAKEIKTGAYTLTLTSGVFVYSINGFKTIIYPTLECFNSIGYLFMLKEILDNENFNDYGLDEETTKEAYETLVVQIPIMLQYPTISIQNPVLTNATMELLGYYMGKVEEHYEKNKDYNEAEQHEALLDVKETMDFVETLKENINIDESNEI